MQSMSESGHRGGFLEERGSLPDNKANGIGARPSCSTPHLSQNQVLCVSAHFLVGSGALQQGDGVGWGGGDMSNDWCSQEYYMGDARI